MYTIGIKRDYFPGFRNFRVKGHKTEAEIRYKTSDGRDIIKPIKPRLVLTLSDNSTYIVADIETRDWKLHKDFLLAKEGEKEWPTDTDQKKADQ
jgi:hypothetical protein